MKIWKFSLFSLTGLFFLCIFQGLFFDQEIETTAEMIHKLNRLLPKTLETPLEAPYRRLIFDIEKTNEEITALNLMIKLNLLADKKNRDEGDRIVAEYAQKIARKNYLRHLDSNILLGDSEKLREGRSKEKYLIHLNQHIALMEKIAQDLEKDFYPERDRKEITRDQGY